MRHDMRQIHINIHSYCTFCQIYIINTSQLSRKGSKQASKQHQNTRHIYIYIHERKKKQKGSCSMTTRQAEQTGREINTKFISFHSSSTAIDKTHVRSTLWFVVGIYFLITEVLCTYARGHIYVYIYIYIIKQAEQTLVASDSIERELDLTRPTR